MKHLLSTTQFSRDSAVHLLDIAEDMAIVNTRDIKKLPALRGKTVANLFFEDSTRTRLSFEAAAKRLSADVITFSTKGSSVSKGEGLKDTAQTLEAIGADAVVIRHSASGAADVLASRGWISASVVNAGDGTHEHPTQALLDAFTMRRRLHGDASRGRDLSGVQIAIVGDILHSRVARSNVWLLQTLGAEVTLVAPRNLLPRGVESWGIKVSHDLDAVVDSKPDAVMMLRVQRERMSGAFFASEGAYASAWGLTEERFARLPESTMILHPGPMNRGLEISSRAADSPQSTVIEQVTSGVAVRMAVLFAVLSGERISV
ncbi:aspartate carbamoyltransferase catalytic subunit [Humidisolicoccus flavus]|uniref:aspartate carbamoyltransferase catalytic subunit n=1 Tax=Humidisolicoccus flavus TaxID=3111414 RepID=UPI00324B61C6